MMLTFTFEQSVATPNTLTDTREGYPCPTTPWMTSVQAMETSLAVR
jgi:hypothetical protein